MLASSVILPMWVNVATAEARQRREFGISTGSHILDFGADELGRYLDGVAATGVSIIRTDLAWPIVQPVGPDRFDWTVPDRVLGAAESRRLKVVAILDYTPAWARAEGTTQFHPPSDPAAFARFCAATATRYRGRVAAYEIWNEPNQDYFWRPLPDPAGYAALLRAACTSIKNADRRATVLGGATTGGWSATSGPKLDPVSFLDRVYAAGAGGSFDAWSHHPYTGDLNYYTTSPWSKMGATTPSLRSVMVARGDKAKQIWATEFGASTADVTEAAQAQLITAACAQIQQYSWAGPLCCYSYRDTGIDASDAEQNFGLVRYDWSAKPALQAYRSAITGR